MCFGCSKEPSHRDGSFEYPQHMFWFRNKKNNFSYALLSWGLIYAAFHMGLPCLPMYLFRGFLSSKGKSFGSVFFILIFGIFSLTDTREIPDILQELPRTNVVSNMKCNKKLEPWGFSVNRRMICTFDKNKGVCNVSRIIRIKEHAT